MPSDEHIESTAAVGIAAVAAVLLIVLDGGQELLATAELALADAKRAGGDRFAVVDSLVLN